MGFERRLGGREREREGVREGERVGCEREKESGVRERVWWERESVGHERVGCVRRKESGVREKGSGM